MLDTVSAHVELVEWNDVLRKNIADTVICAELAVNRFFRLIADKRPERTAFRCAYRIRNQYPYRPFCRRLLRSRGAAIQETQCFPKWDWYPAKCRRKQPRGCCDRQYNTFCWRQGAACPANPAASPDKTDTLRSSIWYSSISFLGRCSLFRNFAREVAEKVVPNTDDTQLENGKFISYNW